jgi:hypothetical protein
MPNSTTQPFDVIPAKTEMTKLLTYEDKFANGLG